MKKRSFTEEETRRRLKKSNSEYWQQRRIKRQLSLEDTVSEFEKSIGSLKIKAMDAVNKDIDFLINRFIRGIGVNEGFVFDAETASKFLNGSLSQSELLLMRSQWASYGVDFDRTLQKYHYQIEEMTRKNIIKMSIEERMTETALSETAIMNSGLGVVVNNAHNLNLFDLSVRTGYDFGHRKYTERDVLAITKRNWSGKHFSKRIWSNNMAIADKMKGLFIERELIGLSTRDIINRLANDTETSIYESSRLIRTEANAMRTEVEQSDAELLGIDKYIIIATLDIKTSDICRHEDGKIYLWKNMEIGLNAPPFHPNCRSIASDYIDEFMDLTKMKRASRNPETGETEFIPANINYMMWKEMHGLNI